MKAFVQGLAALLGGWLVLSVVVFVVALAGDGLSIVRPGVSAAASFVVLLALLVSLAVNEDALSHE